MIVPHHSHLLHSRLTKPLGLLQSCERPMLLMRAIAVAHWYVDVNITAWKKNIEYNSYIFSVFLRLAVDG